MIKKKNPKKIFENNSYDVAVYKKTLDWIKKIISSILESPANAYYYN